MPKEDEPRRGLIIFTYNLSKLDNVTKVRFVYALKGRKEGKGLVRQLNGFFLVPGCFAVPALKSDEIEAALKQWKIPYKKEGVLIR